MTLLVTFLDALSGFLASPGSRELELDPARDAEIELERRERRERESALERERRATQLRLRGVPAKDIAIILSNELRETQALAEARRFLATPNARTLILSGKPGCGKTTAAAWIVSQPSPDRHGGTWLGRWPHALAPRFIDVHRLSRVSRYEEAGIGPLEACAMLAIDDLGLEYADAKGNLQSTLDGLINARYAADLRTIVTTNVPAKGFRRRYGERVADRLRERGRFVELTGESLREKKNKHDQ